MLAQAITYENHPIPWRDVDGYTGGPLNSYVLLWCLPFGIQPTYATGRLFQYFCLTGMFVFLYLAGRRVAGDFAARLALLPAFLFLCWNTYTDFVHYSSEEVSLFLLSWALYLVVKLVRTPNSVALIIPLGLILGLLPLAKLQNVLLGGFLGLTAIGLLFANRHGNPHRNFSRILILIASALAPTIVVLSIVAKAHALGDFWQSYICLAQGYGYQYPSLSQKIVAKIDLLAWIMNPGSDTATFLILITVSTIILGLHRLFGLHPTTRATRKWFIWAILFSFTAVVTVLFTGEEFTHYQFYLLPAFTFLLAVNLRVVGVIRSASATSKASVPFLLAAILSCPLITADILFPHSRLFTDWDVMTPMLLLLLLLWLIGLCIALTAGWLLVRMAFKKWLPSFSLTWWQKLFPLACLIPFFIIPLEILSQRSNEYRGNIEKYLVKSPSAMDQAILRARPSGGRIAIWGWASEFAADTQTPLGTRDASSAFSMTSDLIHGSFQAYYRQRYLADLKANRPELFLEAVGPKNFTFHDPDRYGIASFPDLAQYISEHYRLDQEIDGMRLFLRRDLPHEGTESKHPIVQGNRRTPQL